MATQVDVEMETTARQELDAAFAEATSPIKYVGPSLFEVLKRAVKIAFSSKESDQDSPKPPSGTGPTPA